MKAAMIAASLAALLAVGGFSAGEKINSETNVSEGNPCGSVFNRAARIEGGINGNCR